MIKRNVRYRIENETVIPAIPQYGGVKGEHNATVVAITMDNVLYEDGDAVRLSFTTGDGTVLSSDLLDDVLYTEGTLCVEYALPQLLTVSAGQLCMRLVLSRLDDNGHEVQTCRSPEMVLYFEDASLENGTPFWTGVSEMLARTVTASAAAVKAQESANTFAQTATQNATYAAASAQTAQTAAKKAQQAAASLEGVSGSYTLTETDRASIVTQVLTALGGVPMFGYVDHDHTIVVSGYLTSGEYTVKYEMEDGTVIDIGALSISDGEPIIPDEPDTPDTPDVPDEPDQPLVNLAAPNADNTTDQSIWCTGVYINSSGTIASKSGYAVTNYFGVENGDAIRVKGFKLSRVAFYDVNKALIPQGFGTLSGLNGNKFIESGYSQTDTEATFTLDDENVAYLRLSGEVASTADEVIITKNQPIV